MDADMNTPEAMQQPGAAWMSQFSDPANWQSWMKLADPSVFSGAFGGAFGGGMAQQAAPVMRMLGDLAAGEAGCTA
jgi:hypothetical protein